MQLGIWCLAETVIILLIYCIFVVSIYREVRPEKFAFSSNVTVAVFMLCEIANLVIYSGSLILIVNKVDSLDELTIGLPVLLSQLCVYIVVYYYTY